jgi:hypothetical protein
LHTTTILGLHRDGNSHCIRVPNADGTLYPLDVGEGDALMLSLLALSDGTATMLPSLPAPPGWIHGRRG